MKENGGLDKDDSGKDRNVLKFRNFKKNKDKAGIIY